MQCLKSYIHITLILSLHYLLPTNVLFPNSLGVHEVHCWPRWSGRLLFHPDECNWQRRSALHDGWCWLGNRWAVRHQGTPSMVRSKRNRVWLEVHPDESGIKRQFGNYNNNMELCWLTTFHNSIVYFETQSDISDTILHVSFCWRVR